jgi:integrase
VSSVQSIPFREFRDRISAVYDPPLRSAFTAKRMQATLERCELLGLTSTGELTTDFVRRFIDARPKGESPNTTHTHVAVLRAACNFAAERGWLEVSPFTIRKRWVRKTAPRRRKHHSLEEIGQVLELLRVESEAASGLERWRRWRLRALISTVAYTGLRKMEACCLRVEDLDLEAGLLLLVERKDRAFKTSSSAQPVPVPAELGQVLAGWLAEICGAEGSARSTTTGEVDAGWLFPNATRTGPWVDGGIGYRPLDAFKAAGERAGVKGFNFLSLRHSWATHAERWGLSDTEIQRVLRHTNTRTQWYYRHGDVANLKTAVKRVSFTGSDPMTSRGGDGSDFARQLASIAGVAEISPAKADAIWALLR